MLKNKKNAIVFTLIAMALWGSAIPMIKISFEELAIGPNDTGLKILTAGIRFMISGLFTIGIYYLSGSYRNTYKPLNKKLLISLALVQTGIHYLFFYIGVSNTSGVKGSIIQATNSFMIVLISAVMIPTDKINPKIILALILGTLGVFITSSDNSGSDTSFHLIGDGFILIATFLNALASVLVRKYADGQNPYKLTAYQFIIGACLLLLIGMGFAERELIMSTKGFLLILYGAFVSAASFSIWTIVLMYHSANEFAIYKLFIPIFGSILSVIFLAEDFTKRLAIGMALVLLGSIILNSKSRLWAKK